jgi:putative inorganic carbon (HCO3(-)) transporter
VTFLFQLYLVFLIIRPQEFLPVLKDVPIMQLLLMACLAIWLFRKNKQLYLPPVVLVGCFVLFAPFTQAANGWWTGVALAHAYLDPIVAIFLVTTMAARPLSALRGFMRTIVICACVLVGFCAIQLATGVGPWGGVLPQQGRPYYSGIFSDPNDLGQLFIISLGFVIYFLSTNRSSLVSILLWTLGAWLIYGVVLTNSRGALLAIMAILSLECWRRFGKVAVVVAAVLAVPALLAVTRLSQLSAGEESAQDRLNAWYQGIQMLRSSPIFGVGIGNFTNYSTLTAHNSIVLPMAELGIPGLVMWLGIIWYAFRMLWWIGITSHPDNNLVEPFDSDAQSNDAEMTAEILAGRGLLLTFAGFCVGAFFLSQSYGPPLFLLCGLAVARFVTAAEVLHDAPAYRIMNDLLRLCGVAIAAIIVIYVVVKAAL